MEIRAGPVFASARSAAKDHGGPAAMLGDERSDIARIIRAIGGKKDVGIDRALLALEFVNRGLASMPVTTLRRLGHDGAGRASKLGGCIRRAIYADGDDAYARIDHLAQFGQDSNDTRRFVACWNDDRIARILRHGWVNVEADRVVVE
jgi:hypothetical protein